MIDWSADVVWRYGLVIFPCSVTRDGNIVTRLLHLAALFGHLKSGTLKKRITLLCSHRESTIPPATGISDNA